MDSENQEKDKMITFHGMQKVIAERVGCSSQYVGKILSGTRDTKSEMAQKVLIEAKKFNSILK